MSFYGRGRVSARVRAALNSWWAMVSVPDLKPV